MLNEQHKCNANIKHIYTKLRNHLTAPFLNNCKIEAKLLELTQNRITHNQIQI